MASNSNDDTAADSAIDQYTDERASLRARALAEHPGVDEKLLERFWAAGFFDGEGHAGADAELPVQPGSPVDMPEASPEPRIAIEQGYGELGHQNLLRFQAAVGGVGSISQPRGSTNGGLRRVWRVGSEADVQTVFLAIAPFVGAAKYAQLVKALNVATLRDFRNENQGTLRREG